MSTKDKLDQEAQHIRDVDTRLREIDKHIKEADQHKEKVLRPAPGIDLTPKKPIPNGPGQFRG
jgi:hypothetical protein